VTASILCNERGTFEGSAVFGFLTVGDFDVGEDASDFGVVGLGVHMQEFLPLEEGVCLVVGSAD
jgi:hypothetical protein